MHSGEGDTVKPDSASASAATIGGDSVAAAETVVDISGETSANNFRVETSFDQGFLDGGCYSIPLVVWKKLYVEIDRMYKSGATIVSNGFFTDVNGSASFLANGTPQSAAGTQVTLFSPTESIAAVVTAVSTPDSQTNLNGCIALGDRWLARERN